MLVWRAIHSILFDERREHHPTETSAAEDDDAAVAMTLMQRVKNFQSSNPIRSYQPNIYLKCIYLSILPSYVQNSSASVENLLYFFFSPYTLISLPFDPFCLLTIVVVVIGTVCFITRFTVIPSTFCSLSHQSEFISTKHSAFIQYWLGILFKSLNAILVHILLLIFLLLLFKSVWYICIWFMNKNQIQGCP